MKFTPGIMGGEFSGSVGSTTASRNRYGSYLRSKVVPVNPNSSRQVAVRALFATYVNRWTVTLTQPQRNAWDSWAKNTPVQGKNGSPVTITGQNAYVRYNVAADQAMLAAVDDAPESFNNGNPVTGIQSTNAAIAGDFALASTGLTLSTDLLIGGGALEGGAVSCFVGPPVNSSRKFYRGPYQFFTTIAVLTDDTSVSLVAALTALLNDNVAIGEDQFRGFRFRVISQVGQVSDAFEVLAPVVLDSI